MTIMMTVTIQKIGNGLDYEWGWIMSGKTRKERRCTNQSIKSSFSYNNVPKSPLPLTSDDERG